MRRKDTELSSQCPVEPNPLFLFRLESRPDRQGILPRPIRPELSWTGHRCCPRRTSEVKTSDARGHIAGILRTQLPNSYEFDRSGNSGC